MSENPAYIDEKDLKDIIFRSAIPVQEFKPAFDILITASAIINNNKFISQELNPLNLNQSYAEAILASIYQSYSYIIEINETDDTQYYRKIEPKDRDSIPLHDELSQKRNRKRYGVLKAA